MLKLIPLLALLPGAALAHGGPAGHAHPHGLEGALLALGLILAGVFLLRPALARFRDGKDTRDTAPIPHSEMTNAGAESGKTRGKRGARS